MSRRVFFTNPVSRLVAATALCVMIGCSVKEADAPVAHQGIIPLSVKSGKTDEDRSAEPIAKSKLAGKLTIDGSSTVFPISQAVAEEFMKLHPKVSITVGIAGTGGGFKRFVADDLDVCDASRPIEEQERETCQKNNVGYVELKIGIDGITVVVNGKNNWCEALTVGQLKRLWEPESKIKRWNELDPTFPNLEIILYGPDTDSGTFEYFTEAICGKRGNSRSDYTPSADDNVLVQGVQGDEGALGYFGYAYYALNRQSIKALRIGPDGGKSEFIAPSYDAILRGTYKPLSRPLFIYVNKKAMARAEVVAFLKFYLESAPTLVKEAHYVPLSEEGYAESRARFNSALETQ